MVGVGEAARRARATLFRAGQAAHPSLVVDERSFDAYVARHVDPEAVDAVEELAALRPGECYLACACALGDARAIAIFDTTYGADIERALAKVRIGAMEHADLRQELARRMFLPPHPKVADYSGRGELRAWVRVVATRFALDIARIKKNHAEQPAEAERFAELPATSDSPELALFRRRYQEEVRQSIEEAARALGVEDRNALREHYVRGLTIDQIAAVHGVHRATAARRVQRAREALVSAVKERLTERHGISASDLASVMALIRSQLHLTMDRVLA